MWASGAARARSAVSLSAAQLSSEPSPVKHSSRRAVANQCMWWGKGQTSASSHQFRHPVNRSPFTYFLEIAQSYRILFTVDPMPGLSHIPAPPPPGEDAHLTHSEESQARFCKPCDRMFEKEGGFNQHILSSPMHIKTCCKPCVRDFCSEKDRLMHWGTADAHRYTFDLWCNRNFSNPKAFLNHQRQCPKKHHVCKLCNIDFGPCELDLKKHMEEDGPHKDAYSIKPFEHNPRDNPEKHPVCLLCNSNHPSPCYLAQNTLEEFRFLISPENETQLLDGEPSCPNTSHGSRIISEVAEDIFDDPYAISALGDYAEDNRDLFLHGPESPNNLALNEVANRRQHSKNWYCKNCKVDFGSISLLKEV